MFIPPNECKDRATVDPRSEACNEFKKIPLLEWIFR